MNRPTNAAFARTAGHAQITRFDPWRGPRGDLLMLAVLTLIAGCSASVREQTTLPAGSSEAPLASPEPVGSRKWFELGMADPILDQTVLFYLGQVWHQGADVGEVLQTAARVRANDPYSWPSEWRHESERLEALAKASEEGGHAWSASQAYLRAATYLRAALHRYPNPRDPAVKQMAEAEADHFESYLRLSGRDAMAVEIAYESTTLPGYFFRAHGVQGPAPVIVAHQGRDGWAEDGKYLADAANQRGYHALAFDGPGMGKALRIQGLPFRPDWERVITPAIDFLVTRPEVDPERIALIGISMGGYLAPRAAAFEPRIKLLVANPGVYDWSGIYTGFLQQIDPELLPLLDKDPAAFNQRLKMLMEHNELLRWGVSDSMWHHGVSSPDGLMRDLRRYSLQGLAPTITARTLIIDAEDEAWGQAQELYDALTCPKDMLLHTRAEAAQFHVQVGAFAVATQRLFDWLDQYL